MGDFLEEKAQGRVLSWFCPNCPHDLEHDLEQKVLSGLSVSSAGLDPTNLDS